MPHLPAVLSGKESIFAAIRRGDILLHHPYDSFAPVVDFVKRAADDPQVLAIKQTLYRVGSNSPVVEALMRARENGKQVAVLVELKARFDEENNIVWARALERAGVHVVYGLLGLKTHSKLALVVRREQDGLRRYVHLGTGNYNASTRVFTPTWACSPAGRAGRGCIRPVQLSDRLLQAAALSQAAGGAGQPAQQFANLIRREIVPRKAGQPPAGVQDERADRSAMVRLLYEASQAGVEIDLIIRGICCLRPGVPGVSDNIRVTSIVGRFLEHSRMFYFANGGSEEIFLGSADLMERNLDRRVEVLFPILDLIIAQTMRDEILHLPGRLRQGALFASRWHLFLAKRGGRADRG